MPQDDNSWVFWAKTPDRYTRIAGGAEDDGLWLSLRQHLRDSADVGEMLAIEWLAPSLQTRMARLAGDDDSAVALSAWLAGTHDLGKAEFHFARQLLGRPDVEWLSFEVVRAFGMEGVFPDPLFRRPHAVYSDLIINNWLRREFPEAGHAPIASVAAIAGCHHGKPSSLTLRDRGVDGRLQGWLRQHSNSWQASWNDLINDVTDRVGARDVLSRVLAGGGVPLPDQLMLAGFVTMSDWLASNQEIFELSTSGRHYSDDSRAAVALDRLGMTRSWTPREASIPPFRHRFGWPEEATLRPVQKAAATAAEAVVGPTLIIIEEEMGQGKTEAALLAAEMIAARCGAGGIAFALPTMATTDAMYSRLERWASSAIEGATDHHSLFLGHSRSRLNPEYERLVRRTRGVDSDSASVVAHQWFTGKKGLLAEFAVTTVDQILMAALATRYVTLRHLGLAGKVVIIDEAHSYDVYTSSYLERALTWLAAQGVSVIVLSATLASKPRQKLVAAYKDGLAKRTPIGKLDKSDLEDLQARLRARKASKAPEKTAVTPRTPYPRLTLVDAKAVRERKISQRSGHRKLTLRFSSEDVLTIINRDGKWDTDGGVVGIVCNTVRRAQELYEDLSSRLGDDVELIHSQFTAADRADRELRLIESLGPRSTRNSGRPFRRVVVGTQIIEQSLDIDFDVLISDMAPTDALLQRAGRLHRHDRLETDRPSSFRTPVLHVRGVDTSDSIPEFEPGAVAVYGERVLLGSYAVLAPCSDSEICLMHDLDSLVENTYSDDLAVPMDWHELYSKAVDKERAAMLNSRHRAEQFQVKAPLSSQGSLSGALSVMLEVDATRSDSSAAAHVRDIEPGLEVLLVLERDGYLSPLPWLTEGMDDTVLGESGVPPRALTEVLASSVIRLPRWLVPPGHSIDHAISELEKGGVVAWQADFRLKGQLLLRLNRNLEGELLGKFFRYDTEVGLRAIEAMQTLDVSDETEHNWEESFYGQLDDGVWE